MYLCEVAIVSQLCISFPYILHGLCEDYLTCDIAFNAVMPPSRASTRGRYSRIEGVTVCPLGEPPRRSLPSLSRSSALRRRPRGGELRRLPWPPPACRARSRAPAQVTGVL